MIHFFFAALYESFAVFANEFLLCEQDISSANDILALEEKMRLVCIERDERSTVTQNPVLK